MKNSRISSAVAVGFGMDGRVTGIRDDRSGDWIASSYFSYQHHRRTLSTVY